MQKISPLRSSLEAFKKFKVNRMKNTELRSDIASTNPFGITFKGTVLQMDVFETAKVQNSSDTIKEKLEQAGKLAASAWAGTINKFSTAKANIIAFGSRVKNEAKAFADKLTKTEINLDFMKYNVSNLTKKPVGELGEMLKNEISLLGV